MGVYGGDDGVTADLARDVAIKAALMVGQKLTYEPVARGLFGVKFLSRIYDSTVWLGGDPPCICDIRRQLVKLHVTVRLPPNVTPEQKLVEKCRALALSDTHTPLLGPLAAKVLSLGQEVAASEHSRELHGWSASNEGALRPASEQYNSAGAEWQKYVDEKLSRFDIGRFIIHVNRARTLADLLAFPLCESVEKQTTSSVPVLINGERTTLQVPDTAATPDVREPRAAPAIATPPTAAKTIAHKPAPPLIRAPVVRLARMVDANKRYKGKKPNDVGLEKNRGGTRAGVVEPIAAPQRP
nr:RNA-dependent RNA polymerase [Flumine noda-like virus 45]